LIILPVYAASESENMGITSEILIERCKQKYGSSVLSARTQEDAVKLLKDSASDGDLVVTLGAGNVTRVGEMFLGEN
jgi:UDP-N-acetylmuramate--alanine ligase